MKIAIIEDSPYLSYQIRNILTENKYIARIFRDGKSALEHVPTEEFDLCLVDVNLPDINGYQLVKKLRASCPDVLVIFLTVRDSIADKIEGFEAGGDDYLSKPFEIPELLARIKALLKRKGTRTADIVQVGELAINYDNQTVLFQNQNIDLSVKEFQILEYLLRNKGVIITKDRLGDLIWDDPYELSENIISVYMGKLRKKLLQVTGKPYISTVKNKGYIVDEQALD
jgi:DNA-binding response OmpR family regulator